MVMILEEIGLKEGYFDFFSPILSSTVLIISEAGIPKDSAILNIVEREGWRNPLSSNEI